MTRKTAGDLDFVPLWKQILLTSAGSCVTLQVFVADGEKAMRRLRVENVMVLRTDKKALYIYTESQWINVLVTHSNNRMETQDPTHNTQLSDV